ncbi:hypothetical protein DFH08DRAFT_899618 [Mycena albidolilacea]|uniref:Uncharacterized protein n=1 Tax=Mycena albidolilacea TaxID=1033008 RepID=A0AAD7EB23_9AGAR|nr:hypothetical protein DFH08DRAFT_899618 [Mycena albidolilacea]
MKVVGVAGVTRLLFMGICAGILAARSACAYERLRAPGTSRGVMAFCWAVVVGYSVMVSSVRAGKRSLRRLIVEELVRGRFCCGWSATSSDSRGAQRLEVEGCPSPRMLRLENASVEAGMSDFRSGRSLCFRDGSAAAEAKAIVVVVMGVKRPRGEVRRAAPRLWITRLRPRMIGEVS